MSDYDVIALGGGACLVAGAYAATVEVGGLLAILAGLRPGAPPVITHAPTYAPWRGHTLVLVTTPASSAPRSASAPARRCPGHNARSRAASPGC